MKFKTFEEADLAAIDAAVNAWLLTGNFYCYCNCFNMMPDGQGGENVCLMIFYTEK